MIVYGVCSVCVCGVCMSVWCVCVCVCMSVCVFEVADFATLYCLKNNIFTESEISLQILCSKKCGYWIYGKFYA